MDYWSVGEVGKAGKNLKSNPRHENTPVESSRSRGNSTGQAKLGKHEVGRIVLFLIAQGPLKEAADAEHWQACAVLERSLFSACLLPFLLQRFSSRKIPAMQGLQWRTIGGSGDHKMLKHARLIQHFRSLTVFLREHHCSLRSLHLCGEALTMSILFIL
jgi:hypothetical protein